MTTHTESRVNHRHARIDQALRSLRDALRNGDVEGDERLMRAMTELVRWKNEHPKEGS